MHIRGNQVKRLCGARLTKSSLTSPSGIGEYQSSTQKMKNGDSEGCVGLLLCPAQAFTKLSKVDSSNACLILLCLWTQTTKTFLITRRIQFIFFYLINISFLF